MFKKQFGWALAVGATITIAACSEKTEAGRACPLLCPQTAVTLADTTIDASVVSDTTVTGLPPIGNEIFTMLALHGDTLDARTIVRYDTIAQTYSKNSLDSTIVNIDTAQLVMPIVLPDSLHRPTVPLTIEAYDVDTIGTDTVVAVLAPLFRPSRLIGSKTFAPESLKDTLLHPDLHRYGARSGEERYATSRRTPHRQLEGRRFAGWFVPIGDSGHPSDQGLARHGRPTVDGAAAVRDTQGSAVPRRPVGRLHHLCQRRGSQSVDDSRGRRRSVAARLHALQRPVADRRLYDGRPRVGAADAGAKPASHAAAIRCSYIRSRSWPARP